MPSFLAVFEDSAPFFTYSGTWSAGSSSDTSADLYSESSFFVTQSMGASLSFVFYGTEVSILGAKRGNHGLYQVSLDGVNSPAVSGSATPDEFKATLYNAKTGKGLHNVTLVNREAKFLDVDMISWVASVGQDNEQLIVNTWQDSHPAFVYSPQDAWTTSPPLVGSFSGSTGHGTSSAGATAQLKFKGDAIALYGPAGPTGPTSYSVQVDAGAQTFYSGLKQFQRAKQLLYYGGNLGAGEHTLTLKLESTSDRSQVLAVDYAEIYTTPSLGGSFDAASSSPPIGLVVGIAICAALAALSLGLILYIFILYKRGRFNFAPQREKVDTLAENYHGPGYQTTPLSYPESQTSPSAYASTSATYPSSAQQQQQYDSGTLPQQQQPYEYAPTVGSSSLAYYQPTVSGQNDAGSVAASAATTSTNPSRGRGNVFPSRSIRKNRLHTANGSDGASEAAAAAVPPPAYT